MNPPGIQGVEWQLIIGGGLILVGILVGYWIGASVRTGRELRADEERLLRSYRGLINDAQQEQLRRLANNFRFASSEQRKLLLETARQFRSGERRMRGHQSMNFERPFNLYIVEEEDEF